MFPSGTGQSLQRVRKVQFQSGHVCFTLLPGRRHGPLLSERLGGSVVFALLGQRDFVGLSPRCLPKSSIHPFTGHAGRAGLMVCIGYFVASQTY